MFISGYLRRLSWGNDTCKMNTFLRGLSLWNTWKMKTSFVSCVDSSITSLADGSIIPHTECSRYSLTAEGLMCVRQATANGCEVCMRVNTWFSATTHHATAQHTITHAANRCYVQRRTTLCCIKKPETAQGSERPRTAKREGRCHVCPPAGFNVGKESQKTQLDSKGGQMLVTSWSPPTRMLLHWHCVCVCVCVCVWVGMW